MSISVSLLHILKLFVFQVVELLNQASLMVNDSDKVSNLRQVQLFSLFILK